MSDNLAPSNSPEIEEIRAAILESLAQKQALLFQMQEMLNQALALGAAMHAAHQVSLSLSAAVDTAKELFTVNFPPPSP